MKTFLVLALIGVSCCFAHLHAEQQEEQAEVIPLGPAQYYWLLNRACAHGDEIGARMLLNAGADVDGKSDYKELLKIGFGIEPSWPLNLAAAGGHKGLVKLLIERGAKVDHPEGDGYTALVFAVSHGHEEVVRQLMDAGANPHYKGWEGTPIQIAQKKNYSNILELLRMPATKSERDGADQPAAAVESKSTGNEKTKPESEGRSR